MQTLYLIRHGETLWNRECLLQGQEDVPLSETGKDEARRLGLRLRLETFDRLYASPLQRAWETARLVFPGRNIEPLPELMERHLGILQGLSRQEASQRFPPYAQGGTTGTSEAPPGGESLAEFLERVRRGLSRLEGERVAVVAHGGSLGVLISELLGIPRGRVRLDNASLSVLEQREVWHVRVLNSTQHLF